MSPQNCSAILSSPWIGSPLRRRRSDERKTLQRDILRALVRSLRTLKAERKEAAAFIARTYRWDPDTSAEMIAATLQSLTKDGTVEGDGVQVRRIRFTEKPEDPKEEGKPFDEN